MAPARIEEPCPGRYASSDRVTTTILRKPAIVRSMVVAGLAPVMPITFDLWWNLYTQIYLSAPVLPIQNGYLLLLSLALLLRYTLKPSIILRDKAIHYG